MLVFDVVGTVFGGVVSVDFGIDFDFDFESNRSCGANFVSCW